MDPISYHMAQEENVHYSMIKDLPDVQAQGVTDSLLPGLTLLKSGRSKDIYDMGDNLLLVTSDRLSPHGTSGSRLVPGIGQLTNQLSAYWFQKLANHFPNHFISADVRDFPGSCRDYAEQLDGRAMLVRNTRPLPIICVVRGYLFQSGWREYQETGAMSGIDLPSGMLEAQRLPAPIFIPILQETRTANSLTVMKKRFGENLSEDIRNAALELYFNAWKMAWDRGVLLVESHFEFGILDGRLVLIGECITPHTSLFWERGSHQPGSAPSFLCAGIKPGSQEKAKSTVSTEKVRNDYQDLSFRLTGKKTNYTSRLLKNN